MVRMVSKNDTDGCLDKAIVVCDLPPRRQVERLNPIALANILPRSPPCPDPAIQVAIFSRTCVVLFPEPALMAQESIDLRELTQREYPYGFTTEIDADAAPRGLNEDVVRLISAKKGEPAFLLDWRLRAYRHWLTMTEPRWSSVH